MMQDVSRESDVSEVVECRAENVSVCDHVKLCVVLLVICGTWGETFPCMEIYV